MNRRDLQIKTAKVEARLGSPDGYQTFDTGTNRHLGPSPVDDRGDVTVVTSGYVRYSFVDDDDESQFVGDG